jgi:hypothetical protein
LPNRSARPKSLIGIEEGSGTKIDTANRFVRVAQRRRHATGAAGPLDALQD